MYTGSLINPAVQLYIYFSIDTTFEVAVSRIFALKLEYMRDSMLELFSFLIGRKDARCTKRVCVTIYTNKFSTIEQISSHLKFKS